MTKTKSTKRALLLSILSLVMCVSMLIGSTFAWFTDSVTSEGNKIQAGTLKIDLELLDKEGNWNSIKESKTPIFNYDKWEPGYTDVKILKVENEGTLALKWYAKFTSQNSLSDLANVIDVYVKPSTNEFGYATDRTDLSSWTNVGTVADFVNTISTTTNGTLLPKDADGNGGVAYLGIALKMQETAGNEYQGMDLGGSFDIQIFATQYTHEFDSFDNQYDKGASWTGTVNTDWYNTTDTTFVLTSADELAGFAKLVNSSTDTFEGKTVKLGANIDFNDIAWTPIGSSANGWNSKFNGTFIGTGYTIYNLYVTGTKGVGLFGYVGSSAHIEGVTIDGAYVAGNDYVGAVMGTGYLAANCLKNCTVKNAEIIAMPYLMADGVTYDGGAKAGAVAGYALNGNISGNKAIKCSVTAYRDLGGIVGMVSGENHEVTVSGNSVDTVKLTYLGLNGAAYADNKVNENMGSFVGRKSNTTIAEDNTEANVTRETVITYTVDGITYKKDVDDGVVTLFKVTEDYESDTVNVPDNVATIANYAFKYNSNVKIVVLGKGVTELGRGFDESCVEKVVLNEGLTTISSRAFRKTYNLQEVVFSSTVTTVADNAFQSSGIKNIVFPVNVTSIGDSAFTASTVEDVIIKGDNVEIAHYAFRDCPNLTKVAILSDSVVLGDGMIFTNSQNNNQNPNNITIYCNETVKNTIEANGTFKGTYVTTTVIDNTADSLVEALENGEDVFFTGDVEINPANMSNSYGATGINVKNGQTIDGNGKVLDIKGASGTWDSGINTTGGLIKNLTITGSFRGIFINHNSTHSEPVVLDKVTIDGTTYTVSCDQGKYQTLIATNSTFNGWTSYAATLGSASFTECNFGEGNGYAYCRPYCETTFTNCTFEENYVVDATRTSGIVFENCYVGNTLITAENIEELLGVNPAKVTIK